jgi:hypothetical protein
MKTTKVKCYTCGNEFEKRNADYNRTERLGQRHFCCLSCSVTTRNKELSPEERKNCYDISKHSGNRLDEYSPFKIYLNKGRISLSKHKCEIDVIYLKEMWDKQKGICPYTGIKMILPKNTKEYSIRSLKKASLDRIDSSKDYIKGNVEFVCCAINLAKNSFTRKEMEIFISEIKSL